MKPTAFALRHPIATLMMVVALVSAGLLSYLRMRVDIFPSLHTPKIYVFLQFGGMSPSQMEGLIVNQFELLFQYVDSVQEVKSRSIQQVALLELSFFPGTDMGSAMGQVVAMANRAMSRMPPGTLPPMVFRMDAGSVPVGYLVLESRITSLGMLGDIAQNILRPLVQANVPGTVAVSPFGPNVRSILVNVDPQRLRDYNLTPQDVVNALMAGNAVIPAGNLYVKDSMPMVPTNAMVTNIQDLGKIPLRMGRNVYIRDVATIQDATDVNYGYALVNGKKSVYLPIIKESTASTLTVVSDLRKALPLLRDNVPRDVTINFEFDESPTVKAAVKSVASEGLIGAGLTGLMILIFLHDWRSVIVVVSNIPLSLLGALVGLWATGNTINIMSLGGLALSIGILVDMSTVVIENLHVQLGRTPNVASAMVYASKATAVPIFLALLCILAVFVPAFLMTDPLRSLFMPLTVGVGFALIAAYLLSMTFVPILCVYLVRHRQHGERRGLFDRLRDAYQRLVARLVRRRWWVMSGYLAVCGLVLWLVGSRLGTELFPRVDMGQFVLRFRPPAGSNFELTREMANKCLEVIAQEAGPNNIHISMGFAGQIAPNFGMDNIVLFMRGPDDGWMRVALREGSGIKLAAFRERLRKALPERVVPWLARRLERKGVSHEEAERKARTATFGFQPGNIISEVMSFGAMTPIEVRVIGSDLDKVRVHARKIAREMKRIPFLRDVQYEQSLDYPIVQVDIDREMAGLSGVNVTQVSNGVIVATSSSRFIALNYWQDMKTGFDYQVEVLVPTERMTTATEVEELPVEQVNPDVNLMVRDVATVSRGVMPGEIDRSASQRYIGVTANIEGTDMGRAARHVARAIAAAGEPPRGVRVIEKGQLPPMDEMFKALGLGLAIAVLVIYVLLTAYFESPRMALVSIGAVPGVATGIVLILYFTHTTLNIESFMGAIMSLGVSVSNSVLMVAFQDEHWKKGAPSAEAAVVGAGERLRPILMTACAMVVGMVPMSLALERGSQMQAPLGLAVIGGLVASTFATLLVLPSLFAVVIGRRTARTPSLYPADTASSHYDPLLETRAEGPATEFPAAALQASPSRPPPEDPPSVGIRRADTWPGDL
jgi:multidrug efflux pump subunit AcrB